MGKPFQTASSISFSLDLVSESRAFSPARDHFRVSRVSFDGLRKKRDCSQSAFQFPNQFLLHGRFVQKNLGSVRNKTIETMIDQILILLFFFFAVKCSLSGPKGKQDRRSNLTIKLSAHKRRSMWHARGHSGVVTSQKSEKKEKSNQTDLKAFSRQFYPS